MTQRTLAWLEAQGVGLLWLIAGTLFADLQGAPPWLPWWCWGAGLALLVWSAAAAGYRRRPIGLPEPLAVFLATAWVCVVLLWIAATLEGAT